MARLPRPSPTYDPLNLVREFAPVPGTSPAVSETPAPVSGTGRTWTKRPLFRNGEPFFLTATTAPTAQTIFVARGVNRGWDEPAIYVVNAGTGFRTLRLSMDGTNFWSVPVPGPTHAFALFPDGLEGLAMRGGLRIVAYRDAGQDIVFFGSVLEVSDG